MTLIDFTSDSRLCRSGLLRAAGDAPVADAVVVLLHYGRPEDLTLLDLLHTAGHRGAIAVLAVADEAGAAAERAVREFGDDPAVRRVCHAVVPVAPATAAAAARLGDDEHRLLEQWVARSPQAFESATDMAPGVATVLLDRLGPLGARRALRLVRSGEGDTRAALAGSLVRHSGLGELQELIGSRFLSRADVLRSRTVLVGLDALMQATPPADDGCPLQLPAGAGAGRCARAARDRDPRPAARAATCTSPTSSGTRLNGCSAATATASATASPSPPTRRPSRCGLRRPGRSSGGGRSRTTRSPRRGFATPPRSWCGRESGWRPRPRPLLRGEGKSAEQG